MKLSLCMNRMHSESEFLSSIVFLDCVDDRDGRSRVRRCDDPSSDVVVEVLPTSSQCPSGASNSRELMCIVPSTTTLRWIYIINWTIL